MFTLEQALALQDRIRTILVAQGYDLVESDAIQDTLEGN